MNGEVSKYTYARFISQHNTHKSMKTAYKQRSRNRKEERKKRIFA